MWNWYDIQKVWSGRAEKMIFSEDYIHPSWYVVVKSYQRECCLGIYPGNVIDVNIELNVLLRSHASPLPPPLPVTLWRRRNQLGRRSVRLRLRGLVLNLSSCLWDIPSRPNILHTLIDLYFKTSEKGLLEF